MFVNVRMPPLTGNSRANLMTHLRKTLVIQVGRVEDVILLQTFNSRCQILLMPEDWTKIYEYKF